MIEFYHFFVFLCLSERNHKIQLYQITLYSCEKINTVKAVKIDFSNSIVRYSANTVICYVCNNMLNTRLSSAIMTTSIDSSVEIKDFSTRV